MEKTNSEEEELLVYITGKDEIVTLFKPKKS